MLIEQMKEADRTHKRDAEQSLVALEHWTLSKFLGNTLQTHIALRTVDVRHQRDEVMSMEQCAWSIITQMTIVQWSKMEYVSLV